MMAEILKNPAVRKALEAGEERVGKAVAKLLADERFTTGLQSRCASASKAREALGKGVSQALHAANLPSRDDVAALRRRLDELEGLLDGLAEKVDAPGRRGGGGGRAP